MAGWGGGVGGGEAGLRVGKGGGSLGVRPGLLLQRTGSRHTRASVAVVHRLSCSRHVESSRTRD